MSWYSEEVVRIEAYAGGQLIGVAAVDPAIGSWKSFQGTAVELHGQKVPCHPRFRNLSLVRQWFTTHGADRISVIYRTDGSRIGPDAWTSR